MAFCKKNIHIYNLIN